MRRRDWIGAAIGGGLLAATGGALALGDAMTRPALRPAGAPPPALQAEPVRFETSTGGTVAGWFASGQPGRGAVLLLHGVRGSRHAMLARALFLHRLGLATLAIDLPGHGESPAPHITFGANESHAVVSALPWLARRCPGERIGAIGVSLGAASLVLARPDPAPAAVVLESMYPTIEEAVADRLALHAGAPAAMLAPALLWQMPWRLGIRADQLHPIDALAALRSPLLVAAGDIDRHTTRAETERVFAAARANDKSLWIVPGAAHVDLHTFAVADYERRVGGFLQDRLRGQA
jgi:alpha-beta hydrolase superfamily lysophospholipase